jgi:hypothetical protein
MVCTVILNPTKEHYRPWRSSALPWSGASIQSFPRRDFRSDQDAQDYIEAQHMQGWS